MQPLDCFPLTIFYILVSTVGSAEVPASLRLVTLIYRHGDRSPIEAYPTDPHQEDAWPQGYGQLTQQGMMQEFNLGRFFRQKYEGFLSESYSRHEIYVQSTDMDRTLMSASSVLAGLYPPEGRQKWNADIKWQPIPVHTIPEESDTLLRPDDKCPILRQENLFGKPEAQEFAKKYQELSDYIRDNSGFTNITDILSGKVGRVFDTLFCEGNNGLEWPSWVNQSMVDTLAEEVIPYRWYQEYNSRLQKRLIGGLFVGKTIEKMKLKLDGILDPRYKLSMYSAHDSNVGSILNSLDLFNHRKIPYSIALMFELHTKADNSSSFVRLWLRNDTQLDSFQLTLPGCEPDCPFDKFVNLTRDIVPVDWFMECLTDELRTVILPMSRRTLLYVGLGLLGLTLLVVPLSVCIIKKCCKPKRTVRTYGKIRAETIPEEMPMILNGSTGDLSDEEL